MSAISDSLRELDKLQSALESEIRELQMTLEQRRAALDKVMEIKALAGGGAVRGRRRGRPAGARAALGGTTKAGRPRQRSARGTNADVVVEVMQGINGPERAINIAEMVKAKYPDFSGKSYKTAVFQILQKDPRITRVGRGQYKLK